MRRTNFILITTDQQRADHLGCYGNPVLRTPHIDAIAQRGVAFDRCYVASPVCMPNRGAIMTGRMPSAAGVRMNGVPLPLDAWTFVDALREAGWRTALIGKCHLQNMTDALPTWLRDSPAAEGRRDAVRDRRDGEVYRQESIERWRDPAHEVRLPYYGFEHVELCLEHGDRVGGDYVRWLQRKGFDPEPYRGRANALPHAVPDSLDAWRTAIPTELYPSSFVAERTIGWIDEHRAGSARNDPFFVHCSFPDPHHPLTPPGDYWDLYAPADVVLPATCAAAGPQDVPLKQALHAELVAGRRPKGTSRAIAVTPDEARVAIALNYGAIALIDDVVGRLWAYLQRTGLAEDTVVVFASDHGDFMGDHGLLNKGPLHYRSLIRTPLIWADPTGVRGQRSAGLCSSIDLAPAILARAGVPAYRGMQGRALVDESRAPNGTMAARDAVLIEEETHHRYPGSPFPLRVRSLVTDRWRLSVRGDEAWGELYDLESDPEERHNRWADPTAAAVKSELMFRLVQEMQRHVDDAPQPLRMA